MSESMNATNATLDQACKAPILPLFIGLSTFLILILIVTFIGNLLVILSVIFFRRLHSVTSYFIASLAVSDFLLALLSLPFRIHQNWHNGYWCLALEACITWLVVDSLCTYASMWNLAIISIDRFVVITRPYKYHSWITKKVGCGLISLVWIYSISLALLMFVNWTNFGEPHLNIVRECGNDDRNYYTVVVSLSFFLPLMIIIVLYGKVFQVALNQKRELAALQVNVRGNRPRERNGKRSINLIRELKATKTLAVVVGCFLVCWFPFNVILMISLWDPKYFFQFSPEYRQGIGLTFIYIMPILNSTMNPIIYALMNREFRSAFENLGRRMTGRRLGAVGGAETMMETTTSRTCSILNDNNMDSHGVRFSDNDSDCSAQELPKIPQISDTNSSNSEYSNEQLKSMESFGKNTHETQTMCSPLEDDQKMNLNDDVTMQKHNGHVADEVDITRGNDVTRCGTNDATQNDKDVTENVHALSNSTAELSPSKEVHPSSMDNDSGRGMIGKYSSLTPVESNRNLEVDNNRALPTMSTKRFDVLPR